MDNEKLLVDRKAVERLRSEAKQIHDHFYNEALCGRLAALLDEKADGIEYALKVLGLEEAKS